MKNLDKKVNLVISGEQLLVIRYSLHQTILKDREILDNAGIKEKWLAEDYTNMIIRDNKLANYLEEKVKELDIFGKKHKSFLKHCLDSLNRLWRSFRPKADTSQTPCQFRDVITGKRLSENCPIRAKLVLDKKTKKVLN